MPIIDTPMGKVVHLGTKEEAKATGDLMFKRQRFAESYCNSQGWPGDPGKLSIAQILKIREQPGWKDPQ